MTITCGICDVVLGLSDQECEIICPNCLRLKAYIKFWINDRHFADEQLDGINFARNWWSDVIEMRNNTDGLIDQLLDRAWTKSYETGA